MISGKTQNLGIIGYPIEHTLSPIMQTAALKAAGLDCAYIALSVPPGRLVPALDGLRALYFRGWNVTIPHKSTIIQFLDAIDPDAKLIGAVNTVVNDGGRITGYNTDVIGFLMSIVKAGYVLDEQIYSLDWLLFFIEGCEIILLLPLFKFLVKHNLTNISKK